MRRAIFYTIVPFLMACGRTEDNNNSNEVPNPQPTPTNYTSYFVGNKTDAKVSALGGICLMGGATEDDNAMKWFLNRANGGDVLILRASGADGYNKYFYADLGVKVNSVETIVFNDKSASNVAYILDKIEKSEAIWFAGGDQWKYIDYWRNTPIQTKINEALKRNVVIGGTSAGMAIQGKYIFSAQKGSVTSSEALANPYDEKVTVDNAPFIDNSILSNVITDTHFDNPDRKGRLVAFMARTQKDKNIFIKAIAAEEYTAVCISPDGIASVYGDEGKDDFAYFVQHNCELTNPSPEKVENASPLIWDRDSKALKVYKIKGTSTGNNTIDLKNWKNVKGGIWEDWSVNNSTVKIISSTTSPNCK